AHRRGAGLPSAAPTTMSRPRSCVGLGRGRGLGLTVDHCVAVDPRSAQVPRPEPIPRGQSAFGPRLARSGEVIDRAHPIDGPVALATLAELARGRMVLLATPS